MGFINAGRFICTVCVFMMDIGFLSAFILIIIALNSGSFAPFLFRF